MSLDKRVGRIIRAEMNSGAHSSSQSRYEISSTTRSSLLQARKEILESIERAKQYQDELQSRYEKLRKQLFVWMIEAEKRIQDPGILKQELHKQTSYIKATELKEVIKEIDEYLNTFHYNLKEYDKILR